MRLCKIIIPCQWKPASYGALHFQKRGGPNEIDSCRDGSRAGCNGVDIRKGSPTYGQWEGYILSESNHRQLLCQKDLPMAFVT